MNCSLHINKEIYLALQGTIKELVEKKHELEIKQSLMFDTSIKTLTRTYIASSLGESKEKCRNMGL